MKHQIQLTALLLLCHVASYAQAGDTMTDPIIVGTISSSITYQDTRNTSNYTNQYSGQSTKDVFYQFSLTDSSTVTMTHEGSTVTDTYMHLLNSSGTRIAYNDDYSGEGHCSNTHMSYISLLLAPGTYYIVSEGYSKNGNITTNITTLIKPASVGDSRTNPIISGTYSSDFSYSSTVNTNRYTNQYTGQTTRDVYHRFTIADDMSVTITHDGSTLQDTYMTLLDSNGNLIESNNDYDGPSHCQDTHQSFIQKQLSAGTYYVVSEGNTTDGIIKVNITGNTSSDYGYNTIPSTYSTDPSTSVGGMGGQFAVSPMGGATYSIPIDVPQGINGLQPQLSIVYNSQSGSGICGYGATLSGLSMISRGPNNLYFDNLSRGMDYLMDDALYLDGSRLILASGSTAGVDGAEYYPESDPFTRVISHGTCTSSTNTIYFEVQHSNGMVYWYGSAYSSRHTYNENGNQKVLSWYLDRVIQPSGFFIEYYYDTEIRNEKNFVYIVLIAYGDVVYRSNSIMNTIQFAYETSNGIPFSFDGQQGTLDMRLKTITCWSNTELYRRYTLDYNTTGDGTNYKYSRLTSVTKTNGNNESLPSTRFGWSYLPAISYQSNNLTVSTPSVPGNISLPFEDQILVSGDLNNDGLDDLAGLTAEVTVNGNIKSYLYIYWAHKTNNGIEYSDGTSFQMPDLFNNARFMYRDMGDFHSYFNGSAIADWNGDGNNEILLPYYKTVSGTATMQFYIHGYDQNTQSFWSDTVSCPLSTSDGTLYSIADLNNDGRNDIVVLEKAKNGNKYACHLLSYDESMPDSCRRCDIQLSLSSAPKQIYLSDMKNNGIKDLLVICNSDYSIFWNQGGSYLTSSAFADSNKESASNLEYYSMTTSGDFNGDGLMDILTNEAGTDEWYFNLNNGDGTFDRYLACYLNLTEQNFTDRDKYKFHCDVFDFDGDSKDDVVITKAVYEKQSDINGSWGEFDKTHTYWMRSNGGSLVQIYHATSNRDSDAYTNRFVTGDFNGDGLKELACYGYDCVNGTNANSSAIWRLFKHNGYTEQTGKVTSITGDYGAVTTINYTTLADNTVYTRGSAEPYPAPRYTKPLNVVKETVQSNGAAGNLTTQYTYEGLKIHLRGRGMLGFTKTVANCTTNGIVTESGITQWDTAHYIPKVTYTKTTIGSIESQTTNTLTIISKGGKKYFAFPSQIVETDFDGNTITTVRSYDHDYGYPTGDTITYGTNMYRSATYTDYIKAGGTYHPRTVVQRQRHSDDTTPFILTTTYAYNSIGQVTRKTENQQSADSLTTIYTYDQFGNLASQVSTGGGISTPITTYFSYDVTHRYPTRIYTIPSSIVRKCTYDLWGNILTEQDSINTSITNTITHTYDAWGNRIRTQIPGNGETTYRSGWGSDAGKRFYTLSQGTASPWVRTWYDSRGREVMTESIGPKDITDNTVITYNINGQVSTRTQTTGDLTQTYSYTYDTRGRLLSETAPGNRTVSYQYGNRTVTITENGNRTTTKTFDAWGNLKTLTAPISSLTNTYSSNGGIKTTVSGGSTWTFQYDDRGNRTSMTDPDAGTTTYSYDAMSRETQRIDGRGVVFVTNYDYLGRVTTESATQSGWTQTITHTYGTSGTGQMRLTSESLGSWTKSYEYDAYGRVTSETMTNGTDITRSKAYQYDSNGQLSQKTLPGSVTNSYTYDSYGNLTGVSGASGAIVWSLNQYTGRRAVIHTILDNYTIYPIIRTTTLDQYGYPDTIKTSQYGYYYQIDNYGFSAQTGNLMAMKQKGMDNPMYYNYDNVDRLTSVQIGNQNLMYITYATNGNITSKSDIGSYTYSSTTKPHAVQSVQNTNNEIDYNEQSITYNQWGKVDNIWQTDNTDFYYYFAQYGPDLQKVYSTMDKTYHREYDKFFWGDYEEKTVNGVTTRYYYISGADGLIGLYTEKDAASGTVTNSYAIITDHLGSITMMVDNYDDYNEIRYDPWGNRTVQESFLDEVIDRGYTGHEHLDQLGLIDMKGRMYDPRLGRFLSPDPFIQTSTDPQNFNRYSYCLNNPLKYTDPSGDLFATLFGAISDFVDNICRTVEGKKWRWTKTELGWEIDKGLFMTDPNKNFWDRAKELFSRFTDQCIQTWGGYWFATGMNTFGQVNDVSHGYGMTAIDIGLEGDRAITIGYMTAGPKGYKADWRDHLFVHEYGHYIQSQELGINYLFAVGIPSLQSAIIDTGKNGAPNHRTRWFEVDANRKAAEYFDKYYGSGRDDYEPNSERFFDKNSFENGYPSPYINPRKGVHNQKSYPFESTSHWTDDVILIPIWGMLPYVIYK